MQVSDSNLGIGNSKVYKWLGLESSTAPGIVFNGYTSYQNKAVIYS